MDNTLRDKKKNATSNIVLMYYDKDEMILNFSYSIVIIINLSLYLHRSPL